MRITVSSPDGLGDFILRLPMLQALADGGHELHLLLRKPVAALAADVLPEARVHVFREDPYDQSLKKRLRPFRADIAAVRHAAPDLYMVGAFFPTFFDEEWIVRSKGRVPVAGFEAEESRWGSNTIIDPFELSRQFRTRVRVPIAMPEGEKFRLLSEAILGHPVEIVPPRLPGTKSLEQAREMLRRFGLEPGGFLVVCVGHRHKIRLKEWGEKNWIGLLREVSRTARQPLVFLGTPDESASIERIRAVLPQETRHFSFANPPPPIAVTYALVSLGGGYVGRDGGIMHMAAATGRPVFALFGGVHWPRFLPQAASGTVITRRVACRGCNRFCPFEQPHCLTSLTLPEVLAEWQRWGTTSGLRVVERECDERLTGEIVRADVLTRSWHRQLQQRRGWKEQRLSGWRGVLAEMFHR